MQIVQLGDFHSNTGVRRQLRSRSGGDGKGEDNNELLRSRPKERLEKVEKTSVNGRVARRRELIKAWTATEEKQRWKTAEAEESTRKYTDIMLESGYLG